MVEAGTLDSKSVKILAQVTPGALYAPPGYLLYLDQNALMARPFNARTLSFTGPALEVAENVGLGLGYDFSVSATGLLAYATGSGTVNDQMAWFNREGQKLGTLGQPDFYTAPAFSPDGTRVAVGVGNYGKRDIWVFETKRGTASRLTFNPADDFDPAWTADGSRILFSSDRNGQIDIYQKDANGLGSEQPVFQSKGQAKALDDLSADGRYAIYDNSGSSNSKQLWVLPLFGERKPFVFVQGELRRSQRAVLAERPLRSLFVKRDGKTGGLCPDFPAADGQVGDLDLGRGRADVAARRERVVLSGPGR